jgi:hypothetical protein
MVICGVNLGNECLFKRVSLDSLVAMYIRIRERRLVPVTALFLVTQELRQVIQNTGLAESGRNYVVL